MQHRSYVQNVVDVAKDTINTLTEVNRISDIYRTQQVMYHYFLVQALAVIFLSVAHAPAIFCQQTRQEFYAAIELIKGFSTKSHVSKRLWKTIRGLKEMGDKIGLLARGTSTEMEQDPHSDAAVAMAGLAGHKVDFSSFNGQRITDHEELGVSPDDALQMSNELSNLFEFAGGYANFNQATPGPDGYGALAPADPNGVGDFNAPFGNDPEFARIMNELL